MHTRINKFSISLMTIAISLFFSSCNHSFHGERLDKNEINEVTNALGAGKNVFDVFENNALTLNLATVKVIGFSENIFLPFRKNVHSKKSQVTSSQYRVYSIDTEVGTWIVYSSTG